jgi:signal transduction histidine kinase/DNA-binding response OmpR family regulator/HPt (histidine-containing phosphotransfer) domain-containing protein
MPGTSERDGWKNNIEQPPLHEAIRIDDKNFIVLKVVAPDKPDVKRISLQLKIGFLMVLAVVLLVATGYLAWLNLSSIVASISVDVGPDQKLLTIREISMDLQKAENSIRMYSVTDNEKDLKPYYSVISDIDGKVNRLRDECIDSPLLLAQTDTISKLIEENIYIWNELLYLNQNHRVIEYLMQLPERLNVAAEGDEKSEKGILRRVFSRSEKNRLDEQALITDLSEIEKQDQAVKAKLKLQESHLANTSTRIKEQFYDLTAKMESEVAEILNAKAEAADRLAAKTYRWLAMFMIFGTLLAILVVYIITRYVRKTNAYQVALQASKDEAENLARTKEQFMANMSHEIRTPVTAISGFTEQLLQEPPDEKTARTLKIIRSSSLHLERIINDILDFSKLQDGKVMLEEIHFSVRQIFEDVYAMFVDQARKNNTVLSFSVDPDTPQVLLGDPYRLKQIIINLVSNSVKFTSEGTVHFSVRSIQKQPPAIILAMEVADTGIGIEEDKIDTIFEDLTQDEMSTTRRYGGTGLGLSIVRKLVDLQNGTIECKSRKNQGTTIKCEIPFLAAGSDLITTEVEPRLTVPAEVRNLNVLVVDDEEYNRILFQSIFRRWGVRCAIASNGMEALEMIKAERFGLVLMDMRMPGIDGAKTTEFIRTELGVDDTSMPVICVTAAFLDDDLQKYRKSGMNAFLQKPFSEKALLNTILSVTGKSKPAPAEGSALAEIEALAEAAAPAEIEVTAEGEAPVEVAVPAQETPKRLAGQVDLGNLYRLSGGDEQFVKEMLVTFIQSNEKGLEEMFENLKTGGMEKIADLAHKLMPPCRHLGAADLTAILTEIEKIGRAGGDASQLEQFIGEFQGAFLEIRREIETNISKIP